MVLTDIKWNAFEYWKTWPKVFLSVRSMCLPGLWKILELTPQASVLPEVRIC